MKRKLTLTGIFLIGAMLCGTLFWAGPCLANQPAKFCGGCSMEDAKLWSIADGFCKSNFEICAKANFMGFWQGPYYSAGVCVQNYGIGCVNCNGDSFFGYHLIPFTADECGWEP